MLLVGLTGGIASGKSLVTHLLRELGAHVIDADKIVHELLAPGQEANAEVIGYFGKDVRLADGSIDRRKLGDIVFNDPEKRSWLNSCIHPRVYQVYHTQARHLIERDPSAIVVLDAALLIETDYHKKMDRVIVVYADKEDQLTRLMARDHFTREHALARIGSQMPLEEKRGIADFVIDNRGTREETEKQVRALFETLRKEAARSS